MSAAAAGLQATGGQSKPTALQVFSCRSLFELWWYELIPQSLIDFKEVGIEYRFRVHKGFTGCLP